MLLDDFVLLVVVALLSILALGMGFLLLREAVRVAREFLSQLGEAGRLPDQEASSGSGGSRRGLRRSRATVQRMIARLERGEESAPRRD